MQNTICKTYVTTKLQPQLQATDKNFCFLLLSMSSFGTAILCSEFTDGNMWFPAFMKSQPKDMIKNKLKSTNNSINIKIPETHF